VLKCSVWWQYGDLTHTSTFHTMATTQTFVDYVCEQAGLAGALTYRKMFGEYALTFGGKVVGFACDNAFYLKPTEAGRLLLVNVTEGQPYPGAKSYFLIDHALDEPELLQNLIKVTAAALPMPKPKAPRRSSRR
jgi:TfoX/Sxy family transcriptional regulator of competence genes